MHRFGVLVGLARVTSLAGAAIVLASIVGVGCDSGSDSSGKTAETTTYYGVYTVPGVEAGTLTLVINPPTAALQPAIMPVAATTEPVTALIQVSRGPVGIAYGTFTPPNGPLTISAGAYALAGMISNGVLGGTITKSGASGTFTSLLSDGTQPVIQYCGTFAASDGSLLGTWYMAQSGMTVTGSWAAFNGTGGSSSGTLSGTLNGTTISLTSSDGGTATGTLNGNSVSGTWTGSDGTTSGTWQADTGTCG